MAPDPVYIIEEPPNYEEVMELEMEDLPSYTDVVKAEIHYCENINVWKEIVENCLQVNFVINCDMKEMKLTSDQLVISLP